MFHTIRAWCIPAAAVLLLGLAGCITTVDVKKISAGSNEHGLRYSLPATFLLVQPQADGTASYSWVYLPDPDNTYAIQQHAYLAKFTLDVTIANGLLSKVNSQSDNTAVAAKLFDAAQSTYAAHEQSVAAKSKAHRTSLTAAKAAVAAAQVAVDQANAELLSLKGNSDATSAQKVAAELKLADANVALTAAKKALSALKNGAADLPVQPLAQQWGPVLFRVVQDSDGGVTLLAVNIQAQFDTATAATAAPQQGSSTFKLTLNGSGTFGSATKPLQMTLSIDTKVAGVDKTYSVLTNNGLPVQDKVHWSVALNADGKSLNFTFPDGLPKGSYTLTPAINVNPGDAPVTKSSVTFQVNDN